MTTRRRAPYIWPTWISGLLAGEKSCEFSAWFKAHHQGYEKHEPDPAMRAEWNAAHTNLLRRRADQLRAEGWTVYLEDQNKLFLAGNNGATLGGQADLVAIRGTEVLISDAKSGKPKVADLMQVLVYLLCLPLTHPAICRLGKEYTLAGEIVRPGQDGKLEIQPVPAAMLDGAFRTGFKATLDKLAGSRAPQASPSYSECRFCDLTSADCPFRLEAEPEAAPVAHGLF